MVGDAWPKGPDQIVFDIAVNSGTGRAPQIMGAAMGVSTRNPKELAAIASRSADPVGIVKRACARRASFYRSLATFSAFGRGWLSRNARMEAIGVRMALEAQGAIAIAGQIKREQQGAAVKAKRAAQGAAGSAGAGGASGGMLTQADPSAWDWTNWLAFGLGALAFAALIVALSWAWKKHGERAKAYLASARLELETDLSTVLAKVKAGASAIEDAVTEAVR